MTRKVYGIYPSTSEALTDVEMLMDNGAPADSLLVLTSEGTNDYLTDYGVKVEEYGTDHRSFWDRFKQFFGAEDYSEYDGFTDDLDDGKTILFVEDIYFPVNVDEINQYEEYAPVVDADMNSAVKAEVNMDEEDTVRLVEERLRVNKEPVQRGEVKLRKRVYETEEAVSVPVMHEELIIEKMNPTSGLIADDAFEEETISIPLMEEKVRVEKVPVVSAEYHIRKQAVEGYENVSETLRSEELEEVDEFGNVLTVDR